MSNNNQITLSKRTLGIIAVAVVLLIAGGIVLGLNWNNWFGDKAPVDNTQSGSLDIDPNAGEWQGDLPPEQGDKPQSAGIQIPGYPSITIKADTKEVKMALLNPEGNPCYFTFEIVLEGEDTSIYKSGLVPPGKAIYDVTLEKPLAPGSYNATIKITTNSLAEGNAPMNGANVETLLIAK